jgi:exo-1,4-beta-D-glucosaminidase
MDFIRTFTSARTWQLPETSGNRTGGTEPRSPLRGREVYSLIFKGINYRADIWLNGHKVANRATVVGMYDEFEFNVTEFIAPGGSNVLAAKVTPEHSLEGERGIELGDSWLD